MQKIELSKEDKQTLKKFVERFNKAREKKSTDIVLIDFNKLKRFLTKDEFKIAERFMSVDPRQYGFKGPKLGIKPVPKNLNKIKDQKYIDEQEVSIIHPQFVSDKTYKQYEKLNKKIKEDLERPILIASGYRSAPYQILVFLFYLATSDFNIKKTFARVALPGYSEHGDGARHAVDFVTIYGSPSNKRPADFEKTQEFRWLSKNAKKFGFKMTYPKRNRHGVMYEPWHWRLTK